MDDHLAAYLERSALEHPDRLAVVDVDDAACTYRELDDLAARIASFLLRRGIGRGDRIGVMLPKGRASVATLCGILRAGAAYVPVDASAPAARGRAILADCAVRALFVHVSVFERLRTLPDWVSPELVVTVAGATDGAESWDEVVRTRPGACARAARGPDDLAYVLYTSGSTGMPKGVAITHRNATAFVEWCAAVFTPSAEDRFSSHAPFHFDLSVLDIYLPQRAGAAVVLVPEHAAHNPKRLARTITDQRLTVWYSTPSILSLLARFGELERAAAPSLRLVLFAGEVFPIPLLRALTRLWPHPDYYNLYGPTETNVCTFAKVDTPLPEARTEPWPIGQLCRHCTGAVWDETGREVAPGEEGLLHIAGSSVFRGYWNRPELDARVFTDRDGVRWYDTGDVVRERPGAGFEYVGRRDRMVKRRGYRIELGEIESALHRFEALREAAVVALPDAEAGICIVAYVNVSARDASTSIIALKAYCASALPMYMIPDRFVFVDALPRTSTDKIDYASMARASQKSENP